MRWQFLSHLVFSVFASVGPANAQPPTGWYKSGADPGHQALYEFSVDRTVAHKGKSSASLSYTGDSKISDSQASFHQVLDAANYRGKRVRVTGYLKTDQAGKAGLWARVDGQQDGHFNRIAYAWTGDKSLTGTYDWRKFELFLDIASAAWVIRYGATLEGQGRLWLDSVEVISVGDADPKVNQRRMSPWSAEIEERTRSRLKVEPPIGAPTNLDFES